MEILGVTIHNYTRNEIVRRITEMLDEPIFHHVATVNPEFLLEAEKNNVFRTILNRCHLCVADGFGITLAFLCYGEKLKYRFPGADLITVLLEIAQKKKLRIYLALKKDGLSSFEEIRDVLTEQYPDIIIDGADIKSNQICEESSFIDGIQYDIVFCNFGAPLQEFFLSHLQERNQTRLAMGVGGSFDYLTGKQKRAPWWMRHIGIEWLWRLILQPRRWMRIGKAVIIFPFHIFFAIIKK